MSLTSNSPIDIMRWVAEQIAVPMKRKPIPKASLPPAANWPGATFPISDGTAGKPTATSINGVWVYPDGSTV